MRISAFLLLPLLALPLASAQQPTAQDLAQRVDHHYNQLHSLRTAFTESYQGMGMHRTESGTLMLLKPGRMRWEYSQPAGKLFVLDGASAWFYSKGDAQVQRLPAKKLDDLRSPLRFLLGHTALEKELSHLSVQPAANGQFLLQGQPKGQEQRVRNMKILVTAEGAITSLEIEETDGAITRFSFGHEETNAPLPSSLFHFTPPAGVPVIEAMPPV